MWNWDEKEPIDAAFIHRRIERAIRLRRQYETHDTNAMRLIHAELDGLPGVIVDRYGEVLVLQCLTAGAEYWRDELVKSLCELTGLNQIYERSDVDVRSLEGLPERTGRLGEPPAERFIIQENGLQFYVDILNGQKSGFYLDQRTNRQRLRQLVKGGQVLNCFCYTGAFSVYALAGGASEVLSVDGSAEALAVVAENVALNGFSNEKSSCLEGDVFHLLRTFRDQGRSFDAIILDPPKFAPTIAQAERATPGYKDINLLAF